METTAKDLIEDWIVMRSTLIRQLEVLKAGQMYVGTQAPDIITTEATIIRVETFVRELNALLKEYARV
jgi:hypothetical protein